MRAVSASGRTARCAKPWFAAPRSAVAWSAVARSALAWSAVPWLLALAACDPFHTGFDDLERAQVYHARAPRPAPEQPERLRVMNYNVKFGGGRIDFFFDCHGDRVLMKKSEVIANLEAARAWVLDQNAESLAVGRAYLEGRGEFPQRAALNQITGRFLTDFYAMVADWIVWAGDVVDDWPDTVTDAPFDRDAQAQAVRRAERIERTLGRAGLDRAVGP